MKKYRVKRSTPKPFMNANRLVMLQPGSIQMLKLEKQVKQLIAQGYLEEVIELKKKEVKRPSRETKRPFKKIKGKSETKAKEEKPEQVEETKSKQE